MKKTRRIYINDHAFDAFVLDTVPETYTEFEYDHNAIESVEEVSAEIDPQTLETVMPTVYRIETRDEDNGDRFEYYCVIPFGGMSVEEFVQNLIDNDEENIRHMTEERAAEILAWCRADDYNGEIPDDLTAAKLARIWNEIKGPANISINNGRSYCTPEEAIAAVPWDTIVNAMDDDTREMIAAESHDTELDFLTAYLKAAPCDLIVG